MSVTIACLLVCGCLYRRCATATSLRGPVPGPRCSSRPLARGVRAVGADAGVAVDPVAPGVCGTLAADSGTRSAADRRGLRRGAGEDAEGAAAGGAGVGSVEVAVDGQGGGEPGRPLGEVGVLARGGAVDAGEVGARGDHA